MPSSPIKVRTFLANVALFRELAAAEIDRIAEQTKSLHVERGTVLFQRGEASEGFYIVIFGQVKLSFISKAGDEKVVDLLGPGQSFGEAVMFMERPHVVTAQALTDSMLLFVGKEVVFEERGGGPKFG